MGARPWLRQYSEVIIELLSRRYVVNLDDGLTPEQSALGRAWRQQGDRLWLRYL